MKRSRPARRDGERTVEHAIVPAAAFPGDHTVGDILERWPTLGQLCADGVCVVEHDGHLRGVVPMSILVAAPRTRRLDELMTVFHPLHAHDPQQRAAALALHHGLEAVPVVERDGRLLGLVPRAAIGAILHQEHVEDLHRMAGITRERADASRAMNEPPMRRARHRLPWLLVGLVGSMLASWVMSRFEATLAAITAVAYFIPAIVYLADAVGTQTEAIAVRSLAMADVPLARCVGGEVRTGAIVGLVLGLVSIPGAWLVAGNLPLAVAVGVSVVIASTLASAIGLLLPYALARLHIDPAYGSGPLATIIQDVLSLMAYFACVLIVV